ncbi:MAG TPA: hypothetical protein VK849_03695 [Longimicrobiales bacterium]|nr:hypothetical protein [Longimicrobiales bacterium]
MSDRRLPVRPDLRQLKVQAKEFLRALRRGDPEAVATLRRHHPGDVAPSEAKLADAQLVLARAYGVRSWPRLVLACRVTDAIWRDHVEGLRELIVANPGLLHEPANGREASDWGPPMTYAANLGRDDVIDMLRELGARDFASAAGRAALQGYVGTARRLHAPERRDRKRPVRISQGRKRPRTSAGGTGQTS